jgi:NADPH-dependent glutamate synthase beta subunit-like oxidoreductase|tara:strand:+ start:2850 stop:3113 length:264 start_codon:yes stop_codon:yes gene_type:complete
LTALFFQVKQKSGCPDLNSIPGFEGVVRTGLQFFFVEKGAVAAEQVTNDEPAAYIFDDRVSTAGVVVTHNHIVVKLETPPYPCAVEQ